MPARPGLQLGGLIAVAQGAHGVYLFSRYEAFTLQDVVRYSPGLWRDSDVKPLFVTYQVLSALHTLHQAGTWHGRLASDCVFVDTDLCVTVGGLFKSDVEAAQLRALCPSPFNAETSTGLVSSAGKPTARNDPGLDEWLRAW